MAKTFKLPRIVETDPRILDAIAGWHFDRSEKEGDRHDMIGFRLSRLANWRRTSNAPRKAA